ASDCLSLHDALPISQVASDWTMSVTGAGASPASFAGSTAGTVVTLTANASFSVSESGPGGYAASNSGACSSTGLAPGVTATCTRSEEHTSELQSRVE